MLLSSEDGRSLTGSLRKKTNLCLINVGGKINTCKQAYLKLSCVASPAGCVRIWSLRSVPSPFLCPSKGCSSHLILSSSCFWGPLLLGGAVQEVRSVGCFLFVLIGPECHAVGPLLLDAHHLLDVVLNYSDLDLSKIGTLKWRLEKRRLDFSSLRDFKCKENRTFWINELFEAVGGLPICSSFAKLNLFSELSGGKIFLR